ncbi:hypothetical protein DDE82_000401 [Stemphylium lycopersici]|nr:hypothetical protein DDE82_000401 [Stemphylium lycopersici]
MRNSTVLMIALAATATVAAPVYNDYAIISKSEASASASAAATAAAARVITLAVPMPPFHTDSLTATVPEEWEKPAVATAAAAVTGGGGAPIVVISEDDEYEKEVKKVNERSEWYGPACTIL